MSKRIDVIKAFSKHDSKIREYWKTEFWVIDQMAGYGFIAESKIKFQLRSG